MINPTDLKELLKKHRWTIAVYKSGRQQVFSAKQRRGKKLATCYIGTSNTLHVLTESAILEKINRKATERLANSDQTNDQAYTTNR